MKTLESPRSNSKSNIKMSLKKTYKLPKPRMSKEYYRNQVALAGLALNMSVNNSFANGTQNNRYLPDTKRESIIEDVKGELPELSVEEQEDFKPRQIDWEKMDDEFEKKSNNTSDMAQILTETESEVY